MTARVFLRRCRICMVGSDRAKLVRFNLIRTFAGKTRGAGGVTLCESCWRRLIADRERARPKAAVA